MGTNVPPSCCCPPVRIVDRSLQTTAGVAFNASNVNEDCITAAPISSSSDILMLSDSGIQIDLYHEDVRGPGGGGREDEDPSELNYCRRTTVGPKQTRSYRGRSITDETTEAESAFAVCGEEEAAVSPPSDHSSAPFKNQTTTTTIHRTKGRPAKLTNGGVGGGGGGGTRGIIQCLICDKRFNNSSALAKHKLIHSEERRYSCSLCSKAFKRQDHLNGHLMTHSSKKPYECKFPNCDKSYCDQRSLHRHIEHHHRYADYWRSNVATALPVSGETPLSSSGDGQTMFSFEQSFLSQFSDPGLESGGVNLQASSPVPLPSATSSPNVAWPLGYNPLDEPKPVKCTVCDRRFKNTPALNGHMRLHGGFPGSLRKDSTETEKKYEDAVVESRETDPPVLSRGDASLHEKTSKPGRGWWPSSSSEMVALLEDGPPLEREIVGEDRDSNLGFGFENESRNDTGGLNFLESLLLDGGGRRCGDRKTRSADSPNLTSRALQAVDDEMAENEKAELETYRADVVDATVTNRADVDRVDFTRYALPSHGRMIDRRSEFDDRDEILDFDGQTSSYLTLSTRRNDRRNEERLMETSDRSVGSTSISELPGSFESVAMTMQSNRSVSNSPGLLVCGDHPANALNKSGGRMGQPLTPGYVLPPRLSGYAALSLRRSSLSTIQCGGPATPCTPIAPFVAARHNQTHTPTNSNFFQFPALVDDDATPENGRPPTPANHGYRLLQHQRQHTPLTPLSPYTPQSSTPYTPKTPSRHHRFQFPLASANGGCESPYAHHHPAKSNAFAYHRYHQSSSHFAAQQQQRRQNASHENFQRQVMQVEEEMAKRLNLAIVPENDDATSGLMGLTNDEHNEILFGYPNGEQHQTNQRFVANTPRCRCGDVSLDEIASSLGFESARERTTVKDEENSFEEKMDQTTADLDMDLELNLLNPTMMMTALLGGRPMRTERDTVLGGLEHGDDVLDFLLADDHRLENGRDRRNVVDAFNDDAANSDVAVYSDARRTNDCVALTSNGVVDATADRSSLTGRLQFSGTFDLVSAADLDFAKTDLTYPNPNRTDFQKKMKRKRRPNPIVIPPCVNNYWTTIPGTGVAVGGGYDRIYSSRVDGHGNPALLYAPKLSIDGTAPDVRTTIESQAPPQSAPPQSAPPQSAPPPFGYDSEPTQTGGLMKEMLNRGQEMFIFDQNLIDNFTDVAGVQSFQDVSNYISAVCTTEEKDAIADILEMHSMTNHDEFVGHFDLNHHQTNLMNDLGCIEFGNWRMDEMKIYQQNLLETGKNSLR